MVDAIWRHCVVGGPAMRLNNATNYICRCFEHEDEDVSAKDLLFEVKLATLDCSFFAQ